MPPVTTPCKQEPEAWFPVGSTGPAVDQSVLAVTACQDCPILAACREEGYRAGATTGVWGGLDFDEARQDLPWSAWGSREKAREGRTAARAAAK